MAKLLSVMTIIEKLRSVGPADALFTCDELAHGWSIRADGGPVVLIRKSGRLSISGRNAHVLRKVLGLIGHRAICFLSSEEIEAAGVIFVDQNGHGPGVRLRDRIEPKGPAPDLGAADGQ